MKPSSQLLTKEDGNGYSSIAKEKVKATENLLGARINGANLHTSSCSTPNKNSFGIPSQLQTPISKLSYLSASGHKQSVGASGRTVNEDAPATRTPFRLLAGENLSGSLFSPSLTPRPIAIPSLFDKIVSPALKGHVKRVLVMPPMLSPARRVPVRRRGSELTTIGKQSLFTTPKSSRVDNFRFMTPPKSSRADNVPFAARKSSAVDNELNATGWNKADSPKQHGNGCNVERNYAKKSLGASDLPKRDFALISAHALVSIPSSSRVEHLLEGAHHIDGFSNAEVVQPHNVKHEGKPIDRLKFVKRAIVFMPQLSSTARRVPLNQKKKQPITAPSNHANGTPQSASGKARPEARKTSKSNQIKGKMGGNNEVEVVKKQDAARYQNITERLERRIVTRTGGQAADKAKQQIVHTYKMKSHSSKERVDVIERVPKAKGQNAAGKAKLRAEYQRVGNHQIKSHSSKRDNDIASKTYRNGSYASDTTDVTSDHEGGKVHETCDVDVWKSDDTRPHCDAEFGGHEVQHDDETGTKHHEDFGEYGLSEIKDGIDDKNQKADGHVAVGGGDDKTNLDGSGSKKHSRDDNGTKEHGHDDLGMIQTGNSS